MSLSLLIALVSTAILLTEHRQIMWWYLCDRSICIYNIYLRYFLKKKSYSNLPYLTSTRTYCDNTTSRKISSITGNSLFSNVFNPTTCLRRKTEFTQTKDTLRNILILVHLISQSAWTRAGRCEIPVHESHAFRITAFPHKGTIRYHLIT